MPSKAERRRRKLAARTYSETERVEYARSYEPSVLIETAHDGMTSEARRVAAGGMTDRQEAAWQWFAGLRRELEAGGARGADAQEELAAARLQMTDDEYSMLCELCSPYVLRAAYRVGRSRTRARELEMSALRKLVVYRSMLNSGNEVAAA